MAENEHAVDGDVEVVSIDFSDEKAFSSTTGDVRLLEVAQRHKMQERSHEVKASKEAVKNRLAQVLIWAFVLSLVVVLFVINTAFDQASREQVQEVYIHWLTILASLAGAAIGFNAGASSQS